MKTLKNVWFLAQDGVARFQILLDLKKKPQPGKSFLPSSKSKELVKKKLGEF